ncbi:MAG: SufE family protein [Tepidiformaceae bacterium]
MTEMPKPLAEIIDDFAFVDRAERIELLLEYADRFKEVPPEVAERPFPEENHVTRCESQAYVWATDLPDGTLKYHFAVENPQGISAKAWAVMLDETLSGQPLEQVAGVPEEAVLKVFGSDLSMGKGQGLMGILNMATAFARQRLKARA